MTVQSDRPCLSFIGLGALGSPMAANLLASGFSLHVHNRTAAAAEPLLAAGARWTATPAAAASAADVLCLCLSDDAAVMAVMADAWAGLKPGTLVIDFSTISPSTSQAMAARLQQHGVAYIDAPVTGGTEGARAGNLSVLVGAQPADLERARPVLAVVGGRITHLGPVGAGQQAKAVNQVLVAGSYAAVAEALTLAEGLALPMETLLEALRPGAAGSWALDNRADGMVARDYPLGFKLALHRKDLAIALQAAAAMQLELPISARVAAIEDDLIKAGHGERDVSALAEWFKP
ncbi:MAG: NAD(P)-dependent oxidoreductase [Cyanobacteriota bacterium]|nr:NAD(P)-dependent oxidoreductase [Cyanobacteriota bacterium]